MAFRIEVFSKVPDARSVSKCGFFNSLGLSGKVKKVEVVDAYSVDKKLGKKDIKKAAELLTNSLTENYCISNHPHLTSPLKGEEKNKFPSLEGRGKGRVNFDFAIEISFLPGVTDNVGSTAKETIEDGVDTKFKNSEGIYSSRIYFIKFDNNSPQPPLKIRGGDIEKIADALHNPLIQKATVKTRKEYFTPPYPSPSRGGNKKFLPREGRGGKVGVGFAPNIAKVKLVQNQKVTYVDLFVEDEELERIGKLGILEQISKSETAKERKRLKQSDAKRHPEIREGSVLDRHAPLVIPGKRRGPLALSVDQLKIIRDYFHKKGRRPTDVELEALAQTWSEHCKHTIFADPLDEIKDGIYRHYIKRATNIVREKLGKSDFCVSVFSDNSGGITFDDKHLITHKVETHNTPSSLDPFGGAITGIVGVNRDCLGFGLGAKPIINTYGFCLADPRDTTELYRTNPKEPNLPSEASAKDGKMLSAKRIFEGVVSGINAGGNQSGIPTNDGFVYFDKRYRGKPLVFAGTVGLIPRKIKTHESHIKYPKLGDLIVTLGGRVGLDGIHGATFSSEGLDKHSPSAAVQIGDPITQKKFSDAIVREARGQNLFSSITDCGAGGLSSAVGEMAKITNGCEVLLHKVPVKYPGLAPWQIWISESQERMVLAVPPTKWNKFETLMQKRSVEASVIGKFTNSGNCAVKHKNQVVMDIDLNFLHEGRPINYQVSKKPETTKLHAKRYTLNASLKSYILNLLKRPNITSYSFISSQYDHEVQGSSVTKPLQGKGRVNSEATVSRPVLTSQKGVVLSHGLFPSYSDLDTYHMAAASIDSAVRANICGGGNLNHLAILDNFCWYSGNDPESLHKLKRAAKACFDTATAYNTPFISGKDSMYNDFKGFDEKGNPVKISIPPTLLISAISVVKDADKAVTTDAKMPGDYIYVLGKTRNELGGSEYYNMIEDLRFKIPKSNPPLIPPLTKGGLGGVVPRVDAKKNLKVYQASQKAIEDELIASAVSLSHGGLAAALFKMLIAGQLGAKVNISKLPGNWKTEVEALFSESQGRILVTINPKNAAKFQKLMRGVKSARIGQVLKNGLIAVKNGKKTIVEMKLSEATKAYHSTFKNY